MTDTRKRLIVNTIAMTLKAILVAMISIASSRIVLRTLGIDDFGIYSVVASIIGMMAFINSAMTSATQRFLTFALGKGDLGEVRRIFSASIVTHCGIALIFTLLAETIGLYFLNYHLNIPEDRLNAARWVFHLTVLSVVFNFTSIPHQAILTAYERLVLFAFIELGRHFAKLCIIFYLYYCPYDLLIVYAFIITLVDFAILVGYSLICRMICPESKFTIVRERGLYRQLTSFASWNLFGALANIVKTQGVNVVINMFFYTAVNAAYGVAIQVNAAFVQFSSMLSTASRPQIIKNYAADHHESMFRLAFQTIKICFIMQLVMSVPLLFQTERILDIWLTKERVPEYAPLFCRLMIICSFIDQTSMPFITICNATGRIRLYLAVVSFVLVMTFPILYVSLCFLREPWVAMVVPLGISLVAMQTRLHLIKRLVYFSIRRYYCKIMLPLFSGSLIMIPLFFLNHLTPDHLRLWFNLTIFPATVAVFIYLVVLDKNEKNAIMQIARRILCRLCQRSSKNAEDQ